MRVEKTDYDEYGWRTRIYSRCNETEVVIQKHSNKYPENDHEVYLEGKDLKMVKKFLQKVKPK